jgi:membrane-associated protease RseP (regulator of RpoE activity)
MAKYGEPVISRETRLLLITILVSIISLWVLARLRFQERPITSAPVPPVLAQLRPAAGYADLARVIADIRTSVAATVFASPAGSLALRIRETAAITLAPTSEETRLASDRATGLTIIKVGPADLPGLMPWIPRVLDYPRYLVAAELAGDKLALRPVFVSGLFPVSSALWPGEIWMLPSATQIAAGTFVFTTEGAFSGLVVEKGGRAAIVPAVTLLKAADQLIQAGSSEPGTIGITVQPLSESVSSATGARTGMVVTAVDPNGPAAGQLVPTDIIDAVDGQPILDAELWHARITRINAGDSVLLRLWAHTEVRDVQITAAPVAASPAVPEDVSLGLRLRAIPNVGAEVLSVQSRSRAARAGILPGDIITVTGRQKVPTPTHVARMFAELPDRGSLLVAITRGSEHRVVVVEK